MFFHTTTQLSAEYESIIKKTAKKATTNNNKEDETQTTARKLTKKKKIKQKTEQALNLQCWLVSVLIKCLTNDGSL